MNAVSNKGEIKLVGQARFNLADFADDTNLNHKKFKLVDCPDQNGTVEVNVLCRTVEGINSNEDTQRYYNIVISQI